MKTDKVTALRPSLHGISYLETRSVSCETLKDYFKRLQQFANWSHDLGFPLVQLPDMTLADSPRYSAGTWAASTPPVLMLTDVDRFERMLLGYLDKLYFQGRPAAQGQKLYASVCYFFPYLHKNGQHALLRASRALRGWQKAVPCQSRLPLPWTALLAIIDMLLPSHWEEAVAALLGFHCYLRPFELEGLQAQQLVAARGHAHGPLRVGLVLAPQELGRASKTGQWEEAVVIDKFQPLVGPLLALKRRGEAGDGSLWSFEPGTLTRLLRTTGDSLHLSPFGISAYSLRHGGASHDLLNEIRPLAAVKRRGRWMSDTSLKRYSKETKLIEILARIPMRTLDRGHALGMNLEALLWRHMPRDVLKWTGTV